MDVEIELAGEAVLLLPERAALWVARKTLLVADLHWGKSEVLQRAGIPLPSQALGDDLARLSRAVMRTGAERILALGDLIHAPSGLTPAVIDEVARWRAEHESMQFALVRGNHDRRLILPVAWDMDEMPTGTVEAPFRFQHEPEIRPRAGLVSWAGHVHPAVVMRGRYDRIRLPCFVVGDRSVLMPAFGSLTGGADVKARQNECLYALAGDRVIAI